MPCRDYYDDHPQDYYGPMLANKDKEIEKLRKQISFAESALCATLKAGDELCKDRGYNFYAKIDFDSAGITASELSKWQKKHNALDAKHREEARIKALKETALAKLSLEEKKALGL